MKSTDIKKKLLNELLQAMEKRNLGQRQATALLGITQPRASLLFNKQLEKFSIEYLIDKLDILKIAVEVEVTPTEEEAATHE